ncbi:Tetraacyldisaccharide 4'-kinase [Alkalidesulfovibrio alkalitolerans DSM 16529]|uniref:Tetraacyldisaccharide 4'-kinase n=1 Tax=Alkalidesulfovibrio alkalitolerans DSM 16529 TaxID=1121439 RepID=S7T979_9BACT|nr:tetraacyldisaccharide 4'-kinase [Alkalidesulfovibrio alkalitolerans]EPR33100.1 Tetraacyldisaccharide 4'-kinase [Alkalidesulfovibrio alkalitolerans DSM 16529]
MSGRLSTSGPRGILAGLLAPAGAAWAGLMRLRERAFTHDLAPFFRTTRMAAPVVSVGNIAMGGTGKTPVTAWLCRQALARSLVPCVLTRGYRARPPHLPWTVSPGDPPAVAGDEPLLLARSCPGAHVVVDPVRARGGAFAGREFSPDLFVLDDGFQHLAVARDLNLCLLRPEDLGEEWGRVFPAGYWREGEGALSRADVFLVKTPDGTFGPLAASVKSRLGPFKRPVFAFCLGPVGLSPLAGGPPLQRLSGEAYVLACGVANPGQVAATAGMLLGYPPASVLAFPDHFAFGPDELRAVRAEAARENAPHVVVTAKDAVKIDPALLPEGLVLDVDVSFGESAYCDESFERLMDRRLFDLAAARRGDGPREEKD